jgi:hypothetical protein
LSTAPASAAARSPSAVVDWRQLTNSAVWTALILFTLVALLLAVRRLSGAAMQPIAGPILVLFAAGIATASVLLRLWLLPMRPAWLARRDLRDWLLLAAPSLALAALLAAIITPGTSFPAALAALLFAGAIEGLFWRHLAVAMRPGEVAATVQLPPIGSALDATDDEVAEEESYPANLLQQIVRTREASGEEIHAVLRAQFQPGEQVQVLHVSFCPPLVNAPRLEAFVSGEIDASAKVTSAYGFGARVEVQLSQPADESSSVLVEVTGRS